MKLFNETVKLGVENVEILSSLVRSFLIRIAVDGLSSILKDLARLFQNILKIKGESVVRLKLKYLNMADDQINSNFIFNSTRDDYIGILFCWSAKFVV